MKRMYIGGAILAVVLAAGILLGMAVIRLHGPIVSLAREAKDAALVQDWETAQALTRKARAQWEKYRPFTAAVTDHEPLEEVDMLFTRLEALGQLQCDEEFAADCASLQKMATALVNSQRFTWWNLF